jgi:hypothetical protein
MARFDDDFLDDMKRRTDIVRLIQSYGVMLKERGGEELIWLCPVHDDKERKRGQELYRCAFLGISQVHAGFSPSFPVVFITRLGMEPVAGRPTSALGRLSF